MRSVQRRLTFRELVSSEERASLFRLRHQVYAHQGYWAAQPGAEDRDDYDGRSRFVGAFDSIESKPASLVAGARMVFSEPGDEGYPVEKLYPLEDFPLIESPPRSQIVEFGRTVVDPSLQSAGLGLKLVQALYGLALACGVRWGVASVPPGLLPFYERCSCRPVSGQLQRHQGIETDLCPVVVDLWDLQGEAQLAYESRFALAGGGSWSLVEALKPSAQLKRLRASTIA